MPQVELTLLFGKYAQNYYLGKKVAKAMTETIRSWRGFGPSIIPTPHPNMRVVFWLKKNPWFEDDILMNL